MSYFNEDQRDHMRDLASLPQEAKCDCGWFRRGDCYQSCYGHPEKGGTLTPDQRQARVSQANPSTLGSVRVAPRSQTENRAEAEAKVHCPAAAEGCTNVVAPSSLATPERRGK